MGTKHTPGPWEVTGNSKLYIEPINMRLNYTALWVDCQTCNVRKSTDITEGSQIYNPRKIKEAQANARLIAAAPDLLEACEMAQRALLNLVDPSKEYNHTYNIITEAIVKATE